MEAVNGFKTSIPDDEIALAIIDCEALFVAEFIQKGILLLTLFQLAKVVP